MAPSVFYGWGDLPKNKKPLTSEMWRQCSRFGGSIGPMRCSFSFLETIFPVIMRLTLHRSAVGEFCLAWRAAEQRKKERGRERERFEGAESRRLYQLDCHCWDLLTFSETPWNLSLSNASKGYEAIPNASSAPLSSSMGLTCRKQLNNMGDAARWCPWLSTSD